MAVTGSFQRAGIGRRLLERSITEARRLGARRLYLETNSLLTPAIGLYESMGFRRIPAERTAVSPYERSDVSMELFLTGVVPIAVPGSGVAE